MIGLEYILNLYEMQHIELAEILGIRKQNINMWIKEKQNIPKKHLPTLEKLFKLDGKYFCKKLTEIDKLEIQKEKLKIDLKPVIKKHDKRFILGNKNEISNIPIYDKEEINSIERDIEKAKLVDTFKRSLEIVENNPYIDTYKLIVSILEKSQEEIIVHKTIEALAHYLEVIPQDIATSEEQGEFEAEIFEVFDDYNF